MLSFEELAEARRFLRSFCLRHVPSLLKLKSGISFKLHPRDPPISSDEARHLTATATCYSSLHDAPLGFWGAFKPVGDSERSFAEAALARPKRKWVSEGSAGIYCRCRALPMIISSLSKFDDRIPEHLAAILAQLKRTPDRFGIGEAGSALRKDQWYPPNAFHTYWTLEILKAFDHTFHEDFERIDRPLDISRRRTGMLLWARQQLGHQIGLHSSAPPSSMLDSDQLAWSLTILLRFDDQLTVDLENRDFVKQALRCLFSTQTDGTWRHYKPLFHYKKAGNAYCYVFETFTALLQCALQESPVAEMFRELLKPCLLDSIELGRGRGCVTRRTGAILTRPNECPFPALGL
jgi:hypothetical protein